MMCPPSLSSQSCGNRACTLNMLCFDKRRKVLQQDHKLNTADLSQVCDGRNWEVFRDVALKSNGKTSSPKKNKHVACAKTDNDKAKADAAATDGSVIESNLQLKKISYAPKSMRRNQASFDKQEEQAEFPTLTKRSEDAVNVQAPANPFVYAPKRASRRSQVSPVQPENRNQSSSPPLKQCDETKLNQSREPCSIPPEGATSEQARASTATQEQEGDNPSLSNKSSNSRRRSSASQTSSGRRSPPGEDKKDKQKRSDSGRRRSADDLTVPEQQRTSTKSKSRKEMRSSRRRSIDSITDSPADMSGSRVMVRKLSEPMHRCTTTNQNVMGIMRPARYSGTLSTASPSQTATGATLTSAPNYNDIATLAKESLKGIWEGVEESLLLREREQRGPQSVSISNNSNNLLRRSITLDGGSLPKRCVSDNNLVRLGSKTNSGRSNSPNMMGKGMHRNKSMEDFSIVNGNADWVATGVDFSKSMEVYLFKT